MNEEKAHHELVRVSTVDTSARVRAGDLELMAGPAFTDWRGDWWLSEELLIAAAATSLLDSFRMLAREAGLSFGAFRCTGEAIFHESRGAPLQRPSSCS